MRFRRELLVVALALVASGCSGFFGAVATGKVAKDIIADATSAGNALIHTARTAGDALSAKLGNELTVFAQNATYVAGAEIDKRLSELSTENRLLLERLDGLTQSLKDTKTGAFELKDAVVLDLATLTGDLAVWAKKDFLVQRIDGIAQMQKEGGDYLLRFTGIGFGPDSSEKRGKITRLLAAGQPLSKYRENRPRAFTTEIFISRGALKADDHKVTIVPLQVDVEITSKGFVGEKVATYPVQVQLTLMPKFAGSLSVSWKEPVEEWVTVNARQEYIDGTGDHHQTGGNVRHFPYNWTHRVDDRHRFLGPVTCAANAGGENDSCRWAECKSVSIIENEKVLAVSIEAWGSPCTYRSWAPLQELKATGEKPVEKSYDFVYGANLVVELPTDVSYWRLQGKTVTFQDIDVVAKGSDKQLAFKDLIQSGPVQRAVYAVALPPGVE